MKTPKTFNAGDKVLAKVKGYPAWPAEVVAVSGKKFDVKFYGTGETGCVKPEDLFYYLKHKTQLLKVLKRKDYNDAIEQIEAAIAETGSDGNPKGGDTEVPSDTSPEAKKSAKRKRSMSASTESTQPSKVSRKSSRNSKEHETSQSSQESQESKENGDSNTDVLREVKPERVNEEEAEDQEKGFEKDGESPKKNKEIKEDEKDRIKGEVEEKEKSEEEEETKTESKADITNGLSSQPLRELENIKLIPAVYLTTLILYAEKIKEKEDFYKGIPPDQGTLESEPNTKTRVLPVKLQSGKYIGVKFLPKDIAEFTTEYDRALDDEIIAKNTLELKNELSSGKTEPKEDDDRIVYHLKCDENDIYQMIDQMIISYKKDKLKALQDENELLERIVEIKKSLGLDTARPKTAIKNLEAILEMNIPPITLKKQPHVVETIRRLKRYIGNISCWELSEEQVKAFGNDAKLIRELAVFVFVKFKGHFSYKDDPKFTDKFAEDCRKFKESIKDLSVAQQFSLCAEPNSRKALLDQIYDDLTPEETSKKMKPED